MKTTIQDIIYVNCNFVLRALMFLLLPISLFAADWYVDPVNGIDADGRGAIEAPFRSIQKAVDSASQDDTVVLFPGDHVAGERTVSSSRNRVYVDKRIVIRGKEGRDRTRIIGTYDSNGLIGCGTDAVRCIAVADTVVGCVIEGVTLFGGATCSTGNSESSSNSGGGIYSPSLDAVTLVDCAVVGCRALYGGGASGVTAVRALFADNGASERGAATDRCSHYNCVLVGNVNLGTKETVSIATYPVHVINCTFCGNRSATTVLAYGFSNTVVANCLIALNGQFKTANCGTKETSLKKSYIHNCVNFADNPNSYNTYDGSKAGSACEIFSPGNDDWRLDANAVAVTAGNSKWLDCVPSSYRDKDFYGNDRMTDGAVYCGAVQSVVTAAGGKLIFDAPDVSKALLRVGRYGSCVDGIYAQSEYWPSFVDIAYEEVDDGYGLVRFTQGDDLAEDGSGRIWAYTNGIARLQIPPRGRDEIVSAIVGKKVYAASDAVAGAGDGSRGNPYTLQEAIDADIGGPKLVLAGRGRYETGSKDNNRIRVTITDPMRVAAVYGPSETVICGRDASEPDEYGLGADAMRCIKIDIGTDCVFQGFTLSGGRTASTGSSQTGCGAGIFASNANLKSEYLTGLADCIVTNCIAYRGGAAMSGRLVRCRVVDCTGVGYGVLSSCQAFSCLISDCSSGGNSALCHNVVDRAVGNCTFVANAKEVCKGGNLIFVNNVTQGNLPCDLPDDASGLLCGTIVGTALFAGFDSGDYRLVSCSDGVAEGNPEFLRVSAVDIEGRAYVIRDGHHTSGAFADLAGGCRIAPPAYPGMELSAEGVIVLNENGLDVSVVSDGGRRIIGFSDGVCVITGTTIHVSMDDALNNAPLEYEVVYDRNLYVSPSGDDNNDGLTVETPRRTLASIMSKAFVEDVVHAGEGTYSSGEMYNAEGALASRVVVPGGVSLVSAAGAERTLIVGSASYDPSHDGLGADAVRCVYLNAGASLSGFTVTGGYAAWTNAVDSLDTYGAGVLCEDRTARLSNCVISNNIGYSRVGLSGGSAFRCRIAGNCAKAKSGGHPGVVNTSLDTCLVYGNIGGYNVNVVSGITGCEIRNCSIGPVYGGGQALWVKDEGRGANAVVNTLFFNGAVARADTMTNCVFETEECNVARDTANARMDRIIYGSTAAYDNGCPLPGNAAIDSGDESLSSQEAFEGDIMSGQRIYGGRMDIGCWEYDLRPDLARQIKSSVRFSVLEASPGVRLNFDGGVFIPVGESLVCRYFLDRSRTALFPATVDDGAMLYVALNGSESNSRSFSDNGHPIRLNMITGDNSIVFMCAGYAGGAVVRHQLPSGMYFIVR